ncbi:MAG: S-layer protein, partial [Candidatus Woesearchaeota archaeon]
MNVKKNVKKVFAMATGVALMGATMAGALAYDLSDYPQPFVDKDEGTFDGAIVVGEDAATADVVGAIDIAASLQAQATKEVTVEGSSSVSVEGGEEIETYLNENFVESFDDYDLEGFKDDSVDVNDTDYDYEELFFVDGTVATSFDTDFDDYEDEPYLEFDSGALNYNISFDNGIPSSAIENDELEVGFLGSSLKVTDFDGDDTVTVEASKERVFEEGDSMEIDGRTVELKRVGESSVIVEVDGQSKVMSGGETETFDEADDYKVKLEEGSIFYIDGADDNMATLRLGSSITDTFSDGDALEIFGGTDTPSEATWHWTVKDNDDGDLKTLGVRSNMAFDRIVEDPRDRERNALSMGEELSLPNEHATVSFAGWTSSNMDKYDTLEGYFDEVLLGEDKDRSPVFVMTSSAENIFEVDGNNVQELYIGADQEDTPNTGVFYEDNDGDIVFAGEDAEVIMDLKDPVDIVYDDDGTVNVSIGDEELVLDTNYAEKRFGAEEDEEETDIEYGSFKASNEDAIRSSYGVIWDDLQDMADSNEFVIDIPHEKQEALVTVTSKGSTVSEGG